MIEMDESYCWYDDWRDYAYVTGNVINIKYASSYRGNFNLSFGRKWYYEIRMPFNEITCSQIGFATNLCGNESNIGNNKHSWAIDTRYKSILHNNQTSALFVQRSRWCNDFTEYTSRAKCFAITHCFCCLVKGKGKETWAILLYIHILLRHSFIYTCVSCYTLWCLHLFCVSCYTFVVSGIIMARLMVC